MVSMKLEGGKELADTLNALSSAVSSRILREVLKDVAEPMRKTMSQLAPREPGAPDLANNIVISVARQIGSVSSDEVRSVFEGETAIAVGPSKNFFYGYFQEYGTSRHGAQPFMRPAFDREAPRAIPEIASRLWTVLASYGVHRPMASRSMPVESTGPLL